MAQSLQEWRFVLPHKERKEPMSSSDADAGWRQRIDGERRELWIPTTTLGLVAKMRTAIFTSISSLFGFKYVCVLTICVWVCRGVCVSVCALNNYFCLSLLIPFSYNTSCIDFISQYTSFVNFTSQYLGNRVSRRVDIVQRLCASSGERVGVYSFVCGVFASC